MDNNNNNNNYDPNAYDPYAYNPYSNQRRGAEDVDYESANNASANNGGYDSNAYQTYDNGGNHSRRHSRKKGSFGKTLGKAAAVAVVFGLVSGSVFTGVSYAGSKVLGTNNTSKVTYSTSSTEAASGTTVSSTSTGNATDLNDVSGIVDEVMPSIVAITNTSTVTYQSMWGQSYSQDSTSCGSGIIVAKDDEYLYIATNNHVVADADSLSVKFSDESVVDAETRGTYASGDLAVVMVKLSDISSDTMNTIKIATIGDSAALKVGEPCIAIGNALGYGQSVTTGIVSALGRSVTTTDSTTGTTVTNDNLIQTDAAINPGNSGGALLNEEGEVIGINSVKYSSTEVEGIGYAIPMEDAYPIIQELIENGSYTDTQTAYLGITGTDITSDIAQTYNMPEGVYVYSVYDNSGAAEAGLQAGDIITALDDKDTTSMDDLKSALADYSAGDQVKLTVYRQSNGTYKGYYVTVTLSSADQIDTSSSSSSQSDQSSQNGQSSQGNQSGQGGAFGQGNN